MSVIEAHFFAPDDLNGSTIFECSTDDEFVKGIKLDIQRDKLGDATITFARKVGTGIISRNIVAPDVLIRYLIPAVSPTKYLWGNFIDVRQQKVISKAEKGGEGFLFGGPGPKLYLNRTVVWSASFAGYESAVEKEAGVWSYPASARAGAIYNRFLIEDQANPIGPILSDLSKSFNNNDDSDGTPWADDISEGNDDFVIRIQDDLLKVLWQIEDATTLFSKIDLGEVGDPKLRLDLHQEYGRDLTGDLAFDTVHWIEGVNIADDMDVEGETFRKASHALMRGNDGLYELSSRPGTEAFKRVIAGKYETNSPTVLDNAGVRLLQRQDAGEDQPKLRIVPGFAPGQGLYIPGPGDSIPGAGDETDGHFWVGDRASLSTGQSTPTALDYDAQTVTITGIEMETVDAVSEDSTTKVARSFETTVQLNQERNSSRTTPDRGQRTLPGANGGNEPPVLRRCRAGTIGPSTGVFKGAIADAHDHSDTILPWTVDEPDLFMLVLQGTDGAAVDGAGWFQSQAGGAVGVDASPQAFSFIDSETGGSDHDIAAWGLVDPDNSTDTDSAVIVDHADGRNAGALLVYSDMDMASVAANIRGTASATGTSTSPAVTVTGNPGDIAVAAISYHHGGSGGDDTTITPPSGWTVRAQADTGPPFSSTHDSGIHVVEKRIGASGSETATWTLSTSRQWSSMGVVLVAGGSSVPRDGHPDLIGSDPRIPYCDHRHDVHRDTDPTVDDDETQGYKVGTIWAVLDDLDTPTELVSVWVLADATAGAAVWLEWPGGSSVTEITDLPTGETDTTLVLHPDGAGGVEWGTDATGGGALTQAYAGKNAIGASKETWTTRRVFATKVILANDCLITDIEAYIEGTASGQVTAIQAMLLSDSAGSPHEILSFSSRLAADQLFISTNAVRPRWVGMPIGRWVPAGTYWLAVQSFDVSTVIYKDTSGGTCAHWTAGGDWLVDAIGSTVTTTSHDYSIRANTLR